LFGGSARVNQCQAAVDYEGRKAYIATTTGLLHSYNMETRTSTLIGRPPGGPVTVEEEIMCVWDSTSKRVLYAPWNLLDPVYPTHPVIRYLYAYNPADNTWESFLCGSADGLVAARTMVYDPYQNVTLFLCTHGNSLPEIDGRAFWMFRYSPSGEPPPNYPPAAPTNLRIL
jgi:hypothetical protein